MGNVRREWQDKDYVLGYFGKSVRKARKEYESFVTAGLGDGRKYELTGGGLIRGLGGWIEAKEILKGGVHIMNDERILGDSDFVDSIISHSEESYDKRQRLRQKGYNLNRITERVTEVLGVVPVKRAGNAHCKCDPYFLLFIIFRDDFFCVFFSSSCVKMPINGVWV